MKKINVSAEVIKGLALISMTIDHGETILTTSEILSHTIGRLAFPIFAFLIIQNFYQYHLAKKYLFRLGVFGALTSLILMPFGNEAKNVLWTFFHAILFLRAAEYISLKTHSVIWQGYWLGLLFLIQLPFILNCDYNLLGFLFLMALYAYQRSSTKINYTAVLLTGFFCNASSIASVLVTIITLFILLSGINIKKGTRVIKWWGFYIYYPLHKLLLYGIKALM